MSEIMARSEENYRMGRRLRSLRGAARVSRKQLAEMLEVSYSTLDSWEHGNSPIKRPMAHYICTIFSEVGLVVTSSWLLKGIGDPPQASKELFEEEEVF